MSTVSVTATRRWYITLAGGKRARVDYIDWRWARNWRWYLQSEGYPRRTVRNRERWRGPSAVYLHVEIMRRARGRKVRRDLVVDHWNRNRRDCRRSNLRVCTVSTNNWNRTPKYLYWGGERWPISLTSSKGRANIKNGTTTDSRQTLQVQRRRKRD